MSHTKSFVRQAFLCSGKNHVVKKCNIKKEQKFRAIEKAISIMVCLNAYERVILYRDHSVLQGLN